jgi:hypothetical protein
MLNNHRVGSRPSRVTVAFEDGALSFMLSKDATFEDLADRLAPLGEWHHGKPVSIEVKLAAAFAPPANPTHLGLGYGRVIGAAAARRPSDIRNLTTSDGRTNHKYESWFR